MTFLYPIVLLLLIIPAIAVAQLRRTNRFRVPVPHDHSPISLSVKNTAERAIRYFEPIPAVVLGLIVLIAAGPVMTLPPHNIKKMTNIEVLMDVSGSMSSPFGTVRRYDAAMSALNAFIDSRPHDAFGLTYFAGQSLHWVPLTTDTSAIKSATPFFSIKQLTKIFHGTAVGAALLESKRTFENQPDGDRVVIAISDGESPDLTIPEGNDLKIAKELADVGIKVFTIHIGDDDIPQELSLICEKTGGRAFKAEATEELNSVFRSIDELQRAEVIQVLPASVDSQTPFLMAAAILVSVGLLGSCRMRYTPW